MARKRTTRRRRQKRSRKQRGGNIVGLLDNADGVPIQNQQPIDFMVKFGPDAAKTASDYGNSLSVAESKPQPHVFWKVVSPETLYTIICWDPDAQPKSYLHWLIANCSNGTTDDGAEIIDWTPPSPPKGSGLHRYIFGLFQQAGQLTLAAPPHAGFHAANFAAQHKLTPIAYKGMRINA